MPLLDHFHPPLSLNRHWESFHSAWANDIMRTLNRKILPPGYFAEAQVHIGGRLEVDVATLENASRSPIRRTVRPAEWRCRPGRLRRSSE